ncbi:4-(cytidine 5'-diphospho)-2-C-methyl-D-erythritol kinase [Roseibium sediminis]|uniref:4-(cytidine 5'-diphospho)-2-C-methyl-D-erythritol kinase n=1 Tax=Roseibium sediminis TaxID=1775174 RepID=UPI00123CA45C|nr:4-(cytidine 5'-diphospho)-2-C-methyl-D-erythritol kinase [Roseibium sediminis]
MTAPENKAPATQLARAKVNLSLHVTGQRGDGYHLLDSLVVFPKIGDRLTMTAGSADGLEIKGPFGEGLASDSDNNLVLKARKALEQRTGRELGPLHFTLEKTLPIASGIGGGSSDAAAALRLMNEELALGLEERELEEIALPLGADVPVCLASRPALMRGIGEQLQAAPNMPDCGILLVNPGLAVSTPAVFKALTNKTNSPMPEAPQSFADLEVFCAWLQQTRNDLQAPAISICPEIGVVLDTLEKLPGVVFARMSGSGATCLALCVKGQETAAGLKLKAARPNWWIQAGTLA